MSADGRALGLPAGRSRGRGRATAPERRRRDSYGPAARRSAEEFGARAYTTSHAGRQHIVLGAGADDPHTMYHELKHAQQQRNGPVEGTETAGGVKLSDPGDRHEREAEAAARRISRMTDLPRDE
ncbi:hypothetical protein GCM10027160_26640 [Streptomyces calidiresistens]|uniref:DUF4157 domain-containing protein n=1 Tax=Streptomyces calidiresistens TaxID=1485586 RepID=A0A7W3T5L0_9ACTN|nr:DUF4157 domain-containing protein [Streptomyces calidiresistens]MBB0231196.1 DUF4157 domain-containing protein [Streptomyces calidiresistens]